MMNKFSILIYILIAGFAFSLQSCTEEEESEFYKPVESDGLGWQVSTNLTINQVEGKESFVWYKDLLTFDEYWFNEVVELEMQLVSDFKDVSSFGSIDFYLNAEEKDGFNYSAPYDREGVLLKSFDEFSEEGNFTFDVTVDEVLALYESKFVNPRPSAPLLDEDLFELYWIITNNDGTTLDSRDYVDGLYSFGFSVEHKDFAPPVWAGTFDFAEIDENGDLVPDGETGQVEIVLKEDGETYEINYPAFHYSVGGPYWSANPATLPGSGTITYDFLTGLTGIAHNDPGPYGYAVSWNISNVNGNALDIDFEGIDNYWGAGYPGKVRLTRTDGADWPTNMNTL